MRSDIDIAQEAVLRPITEIAAKAGIPEECLIPYGRHMAKVPVSLLAADPDAKEGALILVTAMTPTSKGEGKTTTTIGLGQALARIGKRTMIAIREPSLGPCMGVKGGAAGGGFSQVLPMEDINLHMTGDLHAITSAHNLLAAMIDNHIHQKGDPEINPRDINWRRAIDMNDRTLRSILVGLDGKGSNGVMREDGFDITAASEVMAVLCLSRSIAELKERLGNIIVGYSSIKKPIYARDIGAPGAMASLLKHAINPNLVQTIEGVPVFVHGGPFANIAHGCNTIVATKMAQRLSDYTVTEAGFGADLGAEKFFDIKCRIGGFRPRAAVLVITTRAIALHGMENVLKHAENIGKFGVPAVVSINRFLGDDPAELEKIKAQCAAAGLTACITDYREAGGDGGLELAEEVVRLCASPSHFKPLYELDLPVTEKVRTVARELYGADDVRFTAEAESQIKHIENLGYDRVPVCIAKTPLSLSDDPKLPGRPKGFTVTVSSARVSGGAGFVVVYTSKIMTMPGLPKRPAAMDIDIDGNGEISGLF